MEIDHVGYAVRNLPKAKEALIALGWVFEDDIVDEDRNCLFSFGNNGTNRVELVASLDRSKPSPVDTILQKVGNTPYHYCYRSNDLEKDVKDLEEKGFRVIVPSQFAIAFHSDVVFLFHPALGIIEIVLAK